MQILQARYYNAMASRDDYISKRGSEMASVWRDSMSALSARYEGALKKAMIPACIIPATTHVIPHWHRPTG